MVEFTSYGAGRAFPADWLLWSSLGYANLVMDTRGQGSEGSPGDTPDPEPEGTNPHYPGFMTRGILDPRTYYYRRLVTDAIRAVDTARTHPMVDPSKVAVTGASQGGGIALAVAGLDPSVSIAMPDVPFLCHFRRAVGITDAAPYSELTGYLRVHRDKEDVVFRTLSYVDGLNFAVPTRTQRVCSPLGSWMTCVPRQRSSPRITTTLGPRIFASGRTASTKPECTSRSSRRSSSCARVGIDTPLAERGSF